MRIIKEKLAGSDRRIVRSDCYGCSLEYYGKLADQAKSDFPTLEDKDISCVVFGGRRYKRTRGIEFEAPTDTPSDYEEIATLEYLL